MGIQRSCIVCGLLLAVVLPTVACAQYGVDYFSRDEYLAGVFSDSLFVAEGRLGDAAGTGQWEMGLGGDETTPTDTAQIPWTSGEFVGFAVDYDFVGRIVTFTLGGETLYFETQFAFFDSIFLRAETEAAGTAIVLTDLRLNGSSVPGGINLAGPDRLRIMQIYRIPSNQDLSLTGRVGLTWDETQDWPADLNFRIRFTNMAVVETRQVTFGSVKRMFR